MATEATSNLLASVLSLSTWLKEDGVMPPDLITSLGLVQRLCRDTQALIGLRAIRIAQLPPTPSPSPSSYSSPTVDTVITAAITCIRNADTLLGRYQTWTPADRAIFNGSANEVRRLLAEAAAEMILLSGGPVDEGVDGIELGKGKGRGAIDSRTSGEGRLSEEPVRSFDNIELLQAVLGGGQPRVQSAIVPDSNTKTEPSAEQSLDSFPTPPARPPKVNFDGSHLGLSEGRVESGAADELVVSTKDPTHPPLVPFVKKSSSSLPAPLLHLDPLRSHPISPSPPVSLRTAPSASPPVSLVSAPTTTDTSPMSGMAALFAASQSSIRTFARQSMLVSSGPPSTGAFSSPVPDRQSWYNAAQGKRQTLPVTHSYPGPGHQSPPLSQDSSPPPALAMPTPPVSPPLHPNPTAAPNGHSTLTPPNAAHLLRPTSQASTTSSNSSLAMPKAHHLHDSGSQIGLAALFGATSPVPLVQSPPPLPASELPAYDVKAPIELEPAELPPPPLAMTFHGPISADGTPIPELDGEMVYRRVPRVPPSGKRGLVCSPSRLYMVTSGDAAAPHTAGGGEAMSAGAVLETADGLEPSDAAGKPLRRAAAADQGEEWLRRTQMLRTKRAGVPMNRVVPGSE